MFCENLHLYKTLLDLEDFSHAYLTSVPSHITGIGVSVQMFSLVFKDIAAARGQFGLINFPSHEVNTCKCKC